MSHKSTDHSPRTKQVWKQNPEQHPAGGAKDRRRFTRRQEEKFAEKTHSFDKPHKGETAPVRMAVLLSGGGRTLQNFVERIERGDLDAHVEVVISSRPGVKGVERAEAAGIDTFVVPRNEFDDSATFSAAVNAILAGYDIELIVLAGFLSLYHAPDHLKSKMMNIHPALIPAFCGDRMYGHHVHEAALDYGAKVSGCTVHFADDEYDTGPIIIQQTVPILEDDTADTLAARIFEVECDIYPKAIQLFAEERLRVEGRRVRILDKN
jgi:phosphoribosylglycinamide formyltransferase-1